MEPYYQLESLEWSLQITVKMELALKEVHNGFKSKSRMKPLNYGK
jgi:hypothetical protein